MNDVLKTIINKFSAEHQMIIAMEECSELIKEISKYLRNKNNRDNIVEEVADVLIMIKYLQLILNISDEELNQMIEFKIERTKNKYIRE